MIELKTDGELAAMRTAGQVVAAVLAAVEQAAAVGVRLLDLDEVARGVLAGRGAKSSFLHYLPAFAPTPFPAVICASVNDAVVHGIPDNTRLADGDLVSIDFGANIDGWHGDAAVSFVVGEPRSADLALIATARRALDAAIATMLPGERLGDIAHAVGAIGRAAGYGIPADFGGHGIGRAMHEAPAVPNEGTPGRGLRLRAGMVLAIEPMFHAGGRDDYRMAGNGWALHTLDGSRAAHVEHTVAITDNGPRVLTLP
ncbi:type I methionyl aminopeptidase [Actinokineospora sp.]|uniref:type I methionyl aminopeptidase n=1 Tax=Actinokineospora sp. TaxID=1872133 RepID=UPI004037E54D